MTADIAAPTERLTEILHGRIEALLTQRPEILFALLYGSAAESAEFRDLDIAVYVDRALVSPQDEFDYACALADQLEAATSMPVDVRVVNDAPLPFRYNVSRGLPIVVHDPAAYHTFRERSWDEYLDFEPVAMRYLEEMR